MDWPPTAPQLRHYSVSEFSHVSGQSCARQIGQFDSTEFTFSFDAVFCEVLDSSAFFDRVFGSSEPEMNVMSLISLDMNANFWKSHQDCVNKFSSDLSRSRPYTFSEEVTLLCSPVRYKANCTISLIDSAVSGGEIGTEAHAVLTDVKVYYCLQRRSVGRKKPSTGKMKVNL